MSKRANGEGSIDQRADGMWRARTYVYDTNGDKIRRTVYGKTREAVATKLVELQSLTQKHIPAAPVKYTVRAFGDEWVRRLRDDEKRKPATVANYEWILTKYVYGVVGTVRLTSLTPAHVRKVMNTTAGLNRKRQDGTVEPLSARTVQLTRAVLRAMLAEAQRDELIHRNVAALVKGPTVTRAEVEPWTSQEVDAFLKVAAGHRLGALFSVGVALGMRKGELLALHWNDVDMDNRTLRVSKTVQRLGSQGLVTGTPKTMRSRRTIPLPAQVIRTLVEHRKAQDAERATAGDAWQSNGLVFASKSGGLLDPKHVNRILDSLAEEAGVRRIRFHDLRHTCATLLLGQGVAPRTVMEVLGHSQMSITTDLYGHVMPTTLRDAADAMDAALGGAVTSSTGPVSSS
jgi:integrase